jgi:tetratricopeptide (TPR) repeat protein
VAEVHDLLTRVEAATYSDDPNSEGQQGEKRLGRLMRESSVSNSIKADQHHFDKLLPYVYRTMALVLKGRCSYDQALEYIRESLKATPDEPLSLITEAEIFEDLQRTSECVSAAQAAIRSSDGKYPELRYRGS